MRNAERTANGTAFTAEGAECAEGERVAMASPDRQGGVAVQNAKCRVQNREAGTRKEEDDKLGTCPGSR